MQNKECLLFIGRFLSETHPIEASLISRLCYNDEIIYSRLSEHKRRMIYELLLDCYSRRWYITLVIGTSHYSGLVPLSTGNISFKGSNIIFAFNICRKFGIASITRKCTLVNCYSRKNIPIKRISVDLPSTGLFYDIGRRICNIVPIAVIYIN